MTTDQPIPGGLTTGYPRRPEHRMRWMPAYNASDTTIPPFGVAKLESIDQTNGVLQINKPLNSDPGLWLLNGSLAIGSEKNGSVTAEGPWWAHYDDADGVPASPEIWGANNSFQLNKQTSNSIGWNYGCKILGGATGSGSEARVIVMPNVHTPHVLMGKTSNTNYDDSSDQDYIDGNGNQESTTEHGWFDAYATRGDDVAIHRHRFDPNNDASGNAVKAAMPSPLSIYEEQLGTLFQTGNGWVFLPLDGPMSNVLGCEMSSHTTGASTIKMATPLGVNVAGAWAEVVTTGDGGIKCSRSTPCIVEFTATVQSIDTPVGTPGFASASVAGVTAYVPIPAVDNDNSATVVTATFHATGFATISSTTGGIGLTGAGANALCIFAEMYVRPYPADFLLL